MTIRLRSLGLFVSLVVLGCGEGNAPSAVIATDAPLIAGTDDRRPPAETADQAFAQDARGFVAALVIDTRVEQDREGNPFLAAPMLYERHSDESDVELCRDERFAREPTPAYCSGTLIAPDLLLTAGHCVVNASECAETAIVFGFEADASSVVQALAVEDIYGCAELIVQSEPDYADYAVLRLDRPVLDREPATIVRDERSLPLGEGIAIAGHPLGLPLKITTGGKVRPIAFGYGLNDPEYFAADVDTFPGNSGSGGFLSNTDNPHALVGVLSSVIDIGSFEYDATRDCDRYARHDEVMVWLTYSHQALGALCDARAQDYPELCSCGDGTCSAAFGEDGTTCATDCDDACGDHLCLGSETPASCAADCGACGDGLCAPSESCCRDCGCDTGSSCDHDVCVPEVESPSDPGYSCLNPLQLEPVGSHTLHTPVGQQLCYRFVLAQAATVRWRGDAATRPSLCESTSCPAGQLPGSEARLEAGTYFLALPADAASAPRTFEVSFSSAQPHDGLTCSSAIDLPTSGATTLHGSTADGWHANRCSIGESSSCYGPERHYAFTLDQPASITALATGHEHIAVVLRAAPCTDGAEIESAVDVSGHGAARLHRVLQPGAYQLIVEGQDDQDRGEYALEVGFSSPPIIDGDDCSDPIVLTPEGSYSVLGDTTLAANDRSAPAGPGCAVRTFGNDRFYTFTLTEKTRVDAYLAADFYGALSLTQAACGPAIRCARGGSEIRRVLDPGTYTLAVDGEESFDAGPYMLYLAFTTSPPLQGESCEDALPITPSGVQHVTGSVSGLADDLGTVCNASTSSDRVYTFTLDAPRTLLVTVQGHSGVYVSLGVGCAAGAGAWCLPLSAEPRAQNRTFAAGTYFLVVDAGDSITGMYDVTIDFDSEPLGQTCFDALPLAIGQAPVTVTNAGHQSASIHSVYYSFTLDAPSQLELSAEAPATFWLTGGLDTIYRGSGALDADVPPGEYCIHLDGPLGGPAFELTAAATELGQPGGRGCDDAIVLDASGGHALSGYVSFGRLAECSSFPAQVYAFQLTESTKLSARVTSGFALALFRDNACSQLAQCAGGSSNSIDTTLAPGHYRLAVAGPPFVPYGLELGFDCDPNECAVEPPDGLDAGQDGGEVEPPDAAIEAGIAPAPDSGVLLPDAMVVDPRPDSSIDEPGDDSGAPADAGVDAAPDDAPPSSSSGCACRAVAPRPTSPGTLFGAGLLTLAVVFRSTRRSR